VRIFVNYGARVKIPRIEETEGPIGTGSGKLFARGGVGYVVDFLFMGHDSGGFGGALED
jgi:hypothetical protein